MEHTLSKPPADIAAIEDKETERAKRFLKSRKMRLTEERMEKIEKDISKKYDSWSRSTRPLRGRLTRYADLLEGVVEETNFPFEGASNITIHYAAGISRTFRSTFNKTMYQDESLFVPVLDPDMELDRATYTALQEGFNSSFADRYNGLEILKDATIPGIRDGVAIIMGSWERELERAADQRVYNNAQEFIKDYPDAESAGIKPEEYQGILDEFIVNPDEEMYVYFDYDFVKFDGIRYRINSFAKFVFFPVFAKRIPQMEMYGNEYVLSESELKLKLKRGQFYERGVEKVKKARGNRVTDGWDKARTFVEGINMGTEPYMPIRALDLVYKTDMDGDGIPEKYLATFAVDAKALLSLQCYPIRRNIDIAVDLRMIARENSFIGVSLIGDTEDLFNQLDILHRHRNNVRMLTTSPVFIAKKDYKELIDMGRAENVIRPGLTLWVDDINTSIKQLQLLNLDQPGNSIDEEQILERHLELAWGPTQGLSGGQSSDDPRSPARKTQMLMMQANQRIDDYMDEWRSSFPQIAELHAALIFQYYTGKEYQFDKNNQTFKFPIELLANPKIHWKAKRRSVQLTPEFAMARLGTLVQIYMALRPLLMVNDPLAMEIWNRQVLNSGEPEAEKLLYDPNTADAQMQKAMQMQQAQKDREIDSKAKLKGKQGFAGEAGKVLGRHVAERATGQSEQQGLNQLTGITPTPPGAVPPQPMGG